MNKSRVGPKGQVVIPKDLREKTGLREGVEIIFEAQDDNRALVIRRAAPPNENCVRYFTSTYAPKLKRKVNIKKLLEEETIERKATKSVS